MLPRKYGDLELAYSILAKATFAAILYGLVFLLASAQPLFGPSQSGPLLPMSPAEAAL